MSFERLTDPARRVIVLAQEEARQLGHDYIDTEHLLLGLIREEQGVAAQTLESLGVTLGSARQQVEVLAGRGELLSADPQDQPTVGSAALEELGVIRAQ